MRRFTFLAASLIPLLAIAGAWGEGNFENDDALEWSHDCTRSTGAKYLAATLNKAVNAEYIEAQDGSKGIAAAEVVAAARGRPSVDLPKELGAWLGKQSKQEIQTLVPLAIRALQKIRNREKSELRQLWDEAKAVNWEKRVLELEARLAK
jgi:hypothetical protein